MYRPTLDREIDNYLQRALPKVVDATIVSEERELDTRHLTPAFWLIDPVDGTINAITGSTDWAISIALIDSASMQPVLGVVYLPLHHDIFVGVSGSGAQLNDKSLSATIPQRSVTGYSTPIISFGVPSDIPSVSTKMGKILATIMQQGWVTRQTGSAAVDICRVARGSWSAFFEYDLMYWDIAAAVIIAREAGCHVALPSNRPRAGSTTLTTPRNVLVVSSDPLVRPLEKITMIASS